MYQKPYHEAEISNLSFLVTGGAGFIGSNLVEYLVKYNAKKIIIFDNFSTGHFHNIETYLTNENVTLIEGDIRDLSSCKKAAEDIDYVFHQAALGSVPRSIQNPITSNDVNVSGFLNMLVVCKDSKTIKRMVYAASSSTYGDSPSLPKVEDVIGKPLSPYAVTKYVNELYADVFYKTYGLETIGLRYFNVFGPKQDPDGAYAAVIPKFVSQFINEKDIIINGDGEHSRDFTYIENVIQANLKAALSVNEKAVNQVFNVAFGDKISLNNLVKTIREELSNCNVQVAKTNIINGPDRPGDVKHSLADISKANQYINYEPLFSFKEGIKQATQWYCQNLEK